MPDRVLQWAAAAGKLDQRVAAVSAIPLFPQALTNDRFSVSIDPRRVVLDLNSATSGRTIGRADTRSNELISHVELNCDLD